MTSELRHRRSSLKALPLHETPIAAFVTAGRAVVPILVSVPESHHREVSAEPVAAPIFAMRNDVTMMAAMFPVVALAESAIERDTIGVVGVRPVLAVDVARDCVACEPAQNDAAHDRSAIAVAHRTSDHAACDGAENGARDTVVVVAFVCSGQTGRRRAKRSYEGRREFQ